MDKTALVVAPDDCKTPSFGYRVAKAFEKLGWKTQSFNYRFLQLHRTSTSRELVNRAFLKKALDMNPDLVFVDKGESINEGIIQKISSSGIKTANWCLDDPFGEFSSFNNIRNRNEYDDFYVFDPYYVRKLKETGQPNAHYLPCAVDSELYSEQTPYKERQYVTDLSFIGSHDEKRENTLNRLSNYNLTIRGYRWDRVVPQSPLYKKIDRKVLKYDKSLRDLNRYCKLLNQSKININIHAPHSRESVNLRAFEIPATKSFQLCDYFSEVNHLFRLNKEIVCYKTIDELKELIGYYLDNEQIRNKISELGHKRVMKEHTFYHRIKECVG
jgi:spore maturation protein CgeB